MKHFLIVTFLLIISTNSSFGQLFRNEDEMKIQIPGFPKKVELIVITGATSLPHYFCKVGNHIISGEDAITDGKLDGTMLWTIGYPLASDSLKVADYFDNYQLDSLELFGDQSHNTNPSGATYYKLKKNKNGTYCMIKKQKVVYDWWQGNSYRLYEGPKIPVTDNWWKD